MFSVPRGVNLVYGSATQRLAVAPNPLISVDLNNVTFPSARVVAASLTIHDSCVLL